MINFNVLDGMRGMVLVVLAFVYVALSIRYLRSYRNLSIGQRLYIGAMICFVMTTAWDTWDYIRADHEFSWRMLPLAMGLTLVFSYLLEPYDSAKRRFGHDPHAPERVMGGSPEEEARLRLENNELRDRLYEVIQRENRNAMERIELEARIEEHRRRSSDSA